MKGWRLAVALVLGAVGAGAFADVPVVENPREAPRVRTIVYDEVWRVGADDEAEYLLGVIGDVTTDPHRNVYLLDTQQQQVLKFSPAGRYLGLVSRQGEGPGEIERTFSIHYAGAGRLALPPHLIMVDTTGVAMDDLELAPVTSGSGEHRFTNIFRVAIWDDHLAGFGMTMSFGDAGRTEIAFLATYTAAGAERHRFGEWPTGYDFTRPIVVHEARETSPLAIWTMDHAGRIYHAVAREVYEILVSDPDGQPLLRIDRPCELHVRSAAEKDEVKRHYTFSSDQELPSISYDIADTDPAIVQLQIVGDELWVTRPEVRRQPPAGAAVAFDVFDLNGHLVEERGFALPYDRAQDALHFLPNGRIVRVAAITAASDMAFSNGNLQRGEERVTNETNVDAPPLEVIVYAPREP